MLNKIRALLAPPVFEDEETTRLARLLSIILLSISGAVITTSIVLIFFDSNQLLRLASIIFILSPAVGLIYLIRLGHLRLVAQIFVLLLWLLLTVMAFFFGGVRSPAFTSYILVILIASILLDGRAGIAVAILSVVTGLGLLFVEIRGTLPVLSNHMNQTIIVWLGQAVNFGLIAFLLYLATDSLNSALRRSRQEIADRQQMEEHLRASETRYRQLFEASRDAVFVINLRGQYQTANPAATKLVGYSLAELCQMTVDDLLFPGQEFIVEERQRAWREGGTLEMMLQHKNGHGVPVELSISPLGKDGDSQLVMGIARDLTSRKQAQEALERSEERYRLFLEQAPIGVQVFNPDGVMVEVNTAWEEMWGVKGDQVVNKFNALTDPQIEQMGLLPFIKQIFAGESINIPDTLYDPEASGMPGRKRWIRTYAYHIKDRDKSVQNVVVLNEDITGLKQVEQSLKESEANLRAILNNTLQAFMLFDRQQRIMAFNNVAANWTKVLMGQDIAVGKLAEELFAGFPLGNFPIAFEKVLQGETISRQTQLQMTDESYWFEVNYTPVVTDDGSIMGVSFSVLDISERKQLEEQLHQTQKMEAIGRLAGGIAHDFNNLLTIIAGNCDLALDQLEENDPLRREFEQIKKAGNRAASLTRQLLAFSRQQVLQPTVLNLNDIVSEISKMLSRLIGEDIELETLLYKDLNLVKVDPGKIEQVIMNLAVNARDAMPQGGKLTIETANVELDEAYAGQHADVTPGSYVMLAISDNGRGMDTETQARIFEPFFTTKEVGEGTGLGLAMVHGIVNQSGGHIWVYSEHGQGTIFKIYLPQVEQEVASVTRRQHFIPAKMATETILLVEDEPMVREFVYRVLTKEGYTVLQANNAHIALQLSQQYQGSIHLLFTDVVMPGGMSGRQLAEQLVLLRPEIKVLYMSGYTDNAIVHHGVLEPGTNFLEKPFTPDALTHKVREVLDSE